MDNIQLYNGDCLEVMQSLIKQDIKVDCILTDPPYGTTFCSWDAVIPFPEMWQAIKSLRYSTTPILLFGMEPFSSFLRLSNIKEYRYDIYWQKERPTNIFQLKKRPGKVIESISVFYKDQCYYKPQMTAYNGPLRTNKIKNGKLGDLIDIGNHKPYAYKDSGKRYPLQIVQFKRDILSSNLHPTQKPVALMEYLIETYTKEGDIILDFAMGSGTTGVACKKLNRKFIGIELDGTYFNIAQDRITKGGN